ncbi:MAG: ImmA/IrrE family metallo-endopeptidase [Candidatus Poribacteria bacterium]|nr:ImmA/IrrE family metallo-endopeptidase [Candidatus Poribacteria bacterium]
MKHKIIKVGNKYYSHNSVVRLIECYSEISQDPEKIIRKLAQEKLTEARDIAETMGISWDGPPFNPQVLASILGIPCEKSDELTHSEDAELHPAENGRMVIRYNPKKPKARQNFSIAHEIAHTLFPGYQNQYKARHRSGKFDPENRVEFLCDIGASEIIMPTPEFDLDVKSRGVSLKSLQELSKLYEVSLEAAANRMVTTDIQPCALVVLGYSHKPTEKSEIERLEYQQNLFSGYDLEPPPMKLRVQYSVRSKRFSSYIPKHKSIKESSPLHEVSVSSKPFQGDTVLNLEKTTLDMYVEAMALPKTHDTNLNSRVIAILFNTRKNS